MSWRPLAGRGTGRFSKCCFWAPQFSVVVQLAFSPEPGVRRWGLLPQIPDDLHRSLTVYDGCDLLLLHSISLVTDHVITRTTVVST